MMCPHLEPHLSRNLVAEKEAVRDWPTVVLETLETVNPPKSLGVVDVTNRVQLDGLKQEADIKLQSLRWGTTRESWREATTAVCGASNGLTADHPQSIARRALTAITVHR